MRRHGLRSTDSSSQLLSVSGDVSLDYALDAMLRASPKRRAREHDLAEAAQVMSLQTTAALLIAAEPVSRPKPCPMPSTRARRSAAAATPRAAARSMATPPNPAYPATPPTRRRRPTSAARASQHLQRQRRMPARDRATAVAMPRRPATRSTSRRPTPPAGRASASRRTIRC
jgi:hypothetical protein